MAQVQGTLAGSYTSMMADPSTKQAIGLGLTSLVNDLLRSRGLEFKKATVLAIADYVSLKWMVGFFQSTLQQATGEQTFSGLLSEGISVSLALMLAKKVNLTSMGAAQGLINSPDLGSGQVASYAEDVIETAILLGERGVLQYIATKSGLMSA